MNIEDYPKRESMSGPRRFSWDAKKYRGPARYNEHNKPAHRYLMSKKGKKWADVWSEICNTNKHDFFKYLREKIDWFIYRNCSYDSEGNLTNNGRIVRPTYYWSTIYVDPKDDIIKLIPKRKIEREKRKSNLIHYKNRTYAYKDGILYDVKISKITKFFDEKYFRPYDVLLKKQITRMSAIHYYGAEVYCSEKSQVSKRLKRKIEKSLTKE